MEKLIDLYKQKGVLHHAYVLEGEKEAVRAKLLDFIENHLKHDIHANPDFWHEKFDVFTIDDARRLQVAQSMKPLSGTRKIFVLEFFGMTIEAQNALLKVFEEPTPGTHIFIIVDSAGIFLPTLRSRVEILKDDARSAIDLAQAEKFLSLPTSRRFDMTDPMIEEKDKAKATMLVDSLLVLINGHPKIDEKTRLAILKDVLKMRSYLNDRSVSLKLILEHLVVTLPKI